jgi:hypothetical protein
MSVSVQDIYAGSYHQLDDERQYLAAALVRAVRPAA